MPINFKKLPPFFTSTTETSREFTRAIKDGMIRKVGPSLYTNNIADDISHLVRQHWPIIIGLIMPGCVVSHRTAFESRISPAGKVYVTGEYPRSIPLPGVTFVQMKGPGASDLDMRFMSVHMSSRPRMILENLTPSRVKRDEESKNVTAAELEHRLTDILNKEKEPGINLLRDQAREVSKALGYEKEFAKLDAIIGALLGTRKATLTDGEAKAHQQGVPFDAIALTRVEALRAALARETFPFMPTKAGSGSSFYNAGFFDAYFSNYIEGTQFEVDEARNIVDTGLVPLTRPSDGHDIIGTYRVVSNSDDMRRVPRTPEEFVEILAARHSEIMAGRPEKRPGQFKVEVNFAGSTKFVEPELVRGTLMQGFGLFTALEHPFAKALLIMFLVAETHPFDDGNGRTARAMMNSELVSAQQTRIIIPSVFRNEYVSSLKRITNHLQPESFIRVMSYAQTFAHSIDFSEYTLAKVRMAECNAFEDPADDKRLLIYQHQ